MTHQGPITGSLWLAMGAGCCCTCRATRRTSANVGIEAYTSADVTVYTQYIDRVFGLLANCCIVFAA